MDKIDRIIVELTELTERDKIHWNSEGDDYVVCDDFPSVKFGMFFITKILTIDDKNTSEGRMFSTRDTEALCLRDGLCAAIKQRLLLMRKNEDFLDAGLADIADFKSRS